MHESEKWKWSRWVVSDSSQPHGRQPSRLLRPWDSPGKNTGVGCHFLLQCMKVKSESEVAESCPTLHDPMDGSPPGSSIHGITCIINRWLSGKESSCQCRKRSFDPWVGKIPWRRKWQPTPVFLPGESHGQRSLVGYTPSKVAFRPKSDEWNKAGHRIILKSAGLDEVLTVILRMPAVTDNFHKAETVRDDKRNTQKCVF